MFENIPQELKFNALWCCWKLTEKGKVPIDAVTGKFAKSNDRNTFNNYHDTLQYLGNYLKIDADGKFTGGLGLGIFNGFSAIDIDHCVGEDGTLSEMAQEIIDYCQSYTEYSPSKKGIRIIFKTDYKDFEKAKYYTNNRKIGLEVYVEGATNKFVTITGNVVEGMEGIGITKVDIVGLLDKYMLKATSQVKSNNEVGVNTYDIKDFIEKDSKLCQLWNAQAGGSGTGESETDLALCSKLAFYLQRDPNAINEAFISSPYFSSKDEPHKSKWLIRQDYRENTIRMAIMGCNAVYTPTIKSEKVTTYGLNDTGNAHRFIDQFGSNIHYNIDNNKWMIWNGVNWQTDVYGNIKNYAEILIEQMQQEAYLITDSKEQQEVLKNINRLFNKNGKENMLNEAQHLSGIPVINDIFDKDDYLLNCQNGVVNLRTGQLLDHNKMQLLSKVTSANYNVGDNRPRRFLQFLNEIFEGNCDIIRYMQKWFGYCLTGDCQEQVMTILVGDGSNGKSLLLQIMNEILGDYSAVSKPDLLIDKKYQGANLSEVARLKGIRFCVINELKMGDRLDESGVKDLVSGNNKIVARFLYGNEFEFYLKAKMSLATNYEPKIIGVDNGIWRRMVKIPFKKVFTDSDKDKTLIDKLRAEKDAILGWMVEGCLMWQHEGLELPECLKAEKENYKRDNDVIQQWIDENCETGNLYCEKSSVLYDSFKSYCIKYNEYPMSQTLFGKTFGKKYSKTQLNGRMVYRGIHLKRSDNI